MIYQIDYLDKFYVLLVIFLISGLSLAEDKGTETEPFIDGELIILDSVDVWGTQVRVPSIHLEDDIFTIKQADHISDLLRPIPGVDVGGAHSLNQRITIRSMDDKDLLISIDGAQQNTYMYHHLGNLYINADILKSVDIDIGTNSVINAGGLGGAVRFETKTAKELLQEGRRFGGRVQIGYGDNFGYNAALTGFGQLTDSLDILAYFYHLDRDNYDVGGGEIKDYDGNEVAGTDGEVRGLEGELQNALIKFGWDINTQHRIQFGYERYIDKGDYSYRPDMGLATDSAISDSLGIPLLWPTELTRDTFTINYRGELGLNTLLKVNVFKNISHLERDESGWADNPNYVDLAGDIEGEATNTGINMLAETVVANHTLTYGAEITDYDTDYQADYDNGTSESSSESATLQAVYIQDQIDLGNQFSIIPGIRYNYYSIDSTVVDDDYQRVTGALALEFRPVNQLLFKVSSTQLFKGPEIGEVFIGAGLNDTPNPDIKAETGINTEVSVAFQDSVFGADSFSTGITIFETRIDNYIYDYATPPATVNASSWKDNIGDMHIDGFEAYIGYDRGPLNLLFSYSRADSALSAFEEYAALDGARLDRKQGNTISFSLDYLIASRNLNLHWDFLVVDDVRQDLDLDGATADNAKDGYSLHNIALSWKPRRIKGLTITAGVDNLFDEYYASQSSRTGLSLHPVFGQLYLLDYEPGRNIKFTLSYDF